MSEQKVIVKTNNLSVGYRQHGKELCLLENLNLTLAPGELVCFMGPNGIGKSSLIRTLAGLQKSLGGSIQIPNEQAVALVLTDKITATHMKVYDLISFGRYPYLSWNISLSDKDIAFIEEAIALVHIEPLIDKRIYELSDGQLQMAMIAKALAQNTPVLLLDEPTAHLDLNNRVEIMNTLRELSRTTGKTILVATHELDLALQTADQVWLATYDKTIKTGVPEDLVLDGSFDKVFQFKGFDLKTGKVQHKPYRNLSVGLRGEGHEYLWTKNALERCGFEISGRSDITIDVTVTDNSTSWMLTSGTNNIRCNSLEELMKNLIQTKN
jgi:iron complex transport system ATP-binding protein